MSTLSTELRASSVACMTEAEMRIAIAEACGWANIEKHNWVTWFGNHPSQRSLAGEAGPTPSLRVVPDYLHDLNAMAGAENTLTPQERDEYYWTHLHVKDEDHSYTVSATARERAVAFLKTKKRIGTTPNTQPSSP